MSALHFEGGLSFGGGLLRFNAYDGGKHSSMIPFIMNECVFICRGFRFRESYINNLLIGALPENFYTSLVVNQLR
jgi:hypothetical protein